eukprot:835368-Rhodomonas_salina.1
MRCADEQRRRAGSTTASASKTANMSAVHVEMFENALAPSLRMGSRAYHQRKLTCSVSRFSRSKLSI